jgi:membrane-associated PAP2 superfamily phosphatase
VSSGHIERRVFPALSRDHPDGYGVLRGDSLPAAIVLIGGAGLLTLVFAITPLDIAAARFFYHAGTTDHWPLARQFPWSLLYGLAPAITASLTIVGLVALAAGQARKHELWRVYGVFLILSILLGPGLISNAIFKDHWDRPRPREVVEFDGALHYTPAPLRGEGGASFPCGHCSVGFLYATGWWLWKRRRPGWARASLALGLVTGFALGLGRMAAGAHFLSDVFWSALIALGVTHATYYYILNIPAYEARQLDGAAAASSRHRGKWLITALATLGASAVLFALFVAPHGRRFTATLDLAALSPPPRVLEVTARSANIDLIIDDALAPAMLVEGELHGFGLPTSRIDATAEFRAEPVPTLSYGIEQRGWITDLDASATIRVPTGRLQRIVVYLQRGNISVTDATQRRVGETGTVQLELRTERGHVQQPGITP